MYILDTNVISELRKSDQDAIIAATALVHDMTVITRNVDNYKFTGVDIINPWE